VALNAPGPRRLHSLLSFYLPAALGLAAGAFAFSRGFRLPVPFPMALFPILLVLPALLLWKKRTWKWRLLGGALVFAIGLAFVPGRAVDREAILKSRWPAGTNQVCGWVQQVEPPRRGHFRFRLRLADETGGAWRAEPWQAQVEIDQKPEGLRIGDRVRLTGNIASVLDLPQGGYRSWLVENDVAFRVSLRATNALAFEERQGGALPAWASPVFSRALHERITTGMKEKFDRYIGSPASALSFGLVTGIKSELPEEIVDDFRRTGTLHVLAVSGSHAVILAAMFYALFRFFGLSRAWSMGLLLFGVFPPYLFLTMFQVSIVRTWLMAAALWALTRAGRAVEGATVLAFSFLAIAWIDPNQLLAVSFQLSFAAVLGMGLALDVAKIRGWTHPISVYLAVSTGAQLFTLPLLAFHFGYVNYFSLFYNTLIIFLVPLSLVYSILLWMSPVAWLSVPLGSTLQLVNHATYQAIHLTRRDFSFFSTSLQGRLLPALLLFTGIVALTIWLRRLPPVAKPGEFD